MKQQVRFFLQLVTSNAERDDVVFAVTSGCSEVAKVSGQMPCMCLYTDDNPLVSFEPPSKPGKPQASVSGDSSIIQLRWEKPKQGGKFYTVLYRLTNSATDTWETCSSANEEATITSLLPKQEYVFKVRAETDVIAGPESGQSDPIVIRNASLQPPAKPYATDAINSSLTLKLNKPQVFKVKAETGSESSPESEVSDPIETKKVIIAPPGKPFATNVTHNSVSLKWTIPPNRNSQLTDSKTSQVSKKVKKLKQSHSQLYNHIILPLKALRFHLLVKISILEFFCLLLESHAQQTIVLA